MKIKNRWNLFLFWVLFLILEEGIFSCFVFGSLRLSFVYTAFFSICFAAIFYLLSNLGNKTLNHVMTYVLLVFFTIFYLAQFVYNQVYFSVISVYSMLHGGGQILQFMGQIIDVIVRNWYVIALFILPLIIFIILDICHFFDFRKVSWKAKLSVLAGSVFFHLLLVGSFFLIPDTTIYSNKRLYFDTHAPLLTADHMGLLTMMRLDIQRSIFGMEEKELTLEEPEEEVDLPIEKEEEYNILEIDFDSLIQSESDKTIQEMHEYFSKQTPSKKNEYTGMFEGKNLVVFVAEAFSQLAIDKELTPTLYRLYEEGFQFTNFYTPLFPVSTADGEYITDTSLIPKEGVWSLAHLTGHYMPYSYANVFEKLGYTSQAYHNNTATYYKRNSYIEAMGYDSFKACGKGLDIHCRIWPQSDLEMIEKTVEDYIHDDHFIAYYMTVSGHLEYSRYGNQMVSKNWSMVKDLPYSDKAKSYLSCNIELDRAIAKLIEELEKNGKLEDTVIAISGDHYPYGLTLDEINELSTYERDENFEIHHMPFLLWNSEMEEVVKVDKYASSLDVLPTILNLFGVEFDSRLLMGRDILSDSDGLVIFSNRSFITDKGKYNAITKKMEKFSEDVDQDYINQISTIIYNKYKYSKLILEKDYYRKVFPED